MGNRYYEGQSRYPHNDPSDPSRDRDRDWERQEQGRSQYGSESHGYGGQYSQSGRYGSQTGPSWQDPAHMQPGGGRAGQDYGGPESWSHRQDERSGADSDWQRGGQYGASGRYSYGQRGYGSQGGYGQSGIAGWNEGWPQKRNGPKGYQRSDERLKEDICERLMQDWRIDSSDVSVDVHDGKVTLSGTVPSRQTRYAIEETVDACMGVKDIDNNVRVSHGGDTETSGGSHTASGSESGSSSSMASSSRTKKES